VLGGMISATVLAVFFVPAFFVFVQNIFAGKGRAGEYADAIAAGERAKEAEARVPH
jgi:multidrug efflux pump